MYWRVRQQETQVVEEWTKLSLAGAVFYEVFYRQIAISASTTYDRGAGYMMRSSN